MGIYAQRRVRSSLADRGLMTESRKMEAVENNGYRTRIYYDIACSKLDKLLVDVEARKAAKDQAEERKKINQTTASQVKSTSIPAVKMNQKWQPDAEALSSYLAAYDIEPRFALYDVLPEFVEYWLSSGCQFRPVEWQAKFHAAVRHQWQGDMNKKYNQSKILQAADLKANAIAAVKAQQAAKLMGESKVTNSCREDDRLLLGEWLSVC